MNVYLKNFLIAVAVLVAGTAIGRLQVYGFNGQGPGAGYAGLLLFGLLYPGLGFVSTVAAFIANGSRFAFYAGGAALFFFSMTVGAFLLGH